MGCFCDRPAALPPPEKRRISSVDEIQLRPGLFLHSSTSSFDYHYHLLSITLGKGAFCEVRKCQHKRTGVIRAVKIIDKHGLDEVTTDNFAGEVEILKKLDHPNIMRVFEVYDESRYYYMVMECCTGRELFEMLTTSERIYEEQAADIMSQLFSAVTYLHSMNVVHRDLKPENILVSQIADSPRCHVTIIDFETAALLDVQHQLTGSFGTVYYMAPEVLEGRYNEKCDLWSLGVILYILLSGKPPFDGDTERHIARSIKAMVLRFEEEEWEYVSEDAKDLVEKLLEKNISQRISAKEAVNHPWIKAHRHTTPPARASSVLAHLRSFHRLTKLKSAVHTFILTQFLDQRHLAELREVFNHMDGDHDGVVQPADLLRTYKELYPLEDAEERVREVMARMDGNRGGLNYTEFLRMTIDRKEVLNRDNLRKAFEMFDGDGNGFVASDEVREWLDDGLHMAPGVIDELIRQMDKDGDGRLVLQDFEDLLEGYKEESSPL